MIIIRFSGVLCVLCADVSSLDLPRSTADSIIPLRHPIKSTDGKTRDSIFIPKGTEIYMGFVSVNTDKRIWGPDALEWKPERWLSPPPQSVIDAKVPGVLSGLMTFASGAKCTSYAR